MSRPDRPLPMWYPSSWRDLHRRSNAGLGLPNKPEITPPANSHHVRDSTAPETLAWCAWIIARLGGWKGYRISEGPPGPLTMRRGYEQFCSIHKGYTLAKSS